MLDRRGRAGAPLFAPPPLRAGGRPRSRFRTVAEGDQPFATWVRHNVAEHKVAGYRNVFVALKEPGAPGDIDADQMEAVADLPIAIASARFAPRITRTCYWPTCACRSYLLWHALEAQKLAAPVIGTLADMICCPGLIIAVWPMPVRFRSLSRSTRNSTGSMISTIWARSASTCPAA